MSEVKKGKVTKLNAKTGTTKKGGTWELWSFQLEGDNTFYGCGFAKPSCADGDYIKFAFDLEEYQGKEKTVVDLESIEILPQEAAKEVDTVISDKDKYWADKDKKIQLYGCREAAVELVVVALKEGILPEIPKAKKGQQFDLFLDLVDKVTDRFFQQAEALVADTTDEEEKVDEDEGLPNPNAVDFDD